MDDSNAIVDRRIDFVFIFDVTDGNPNGDPDAGNLPRIDPQTMHGLVTDVAIKRKLRNYVQLAKQGEPPWEIYVKHRGVLNTEHRRAYEFHKIPLAKPAVEPIPEPLRDKFARADSLPEGFVVLDPEEAAPRLEYDGSLGKDELKEALAEIKESLGDDALKLAKTVAQKAKSQKASREDVDKTRKWMCKNFYDVRTFGAVMSTKINCGQVRGPVQLTFSRSVDPIVPLEVSLTRVAVTKEEDATRKETEMGRKSLVPYGLYVGHGFVSPSFAADTGFTRGDLALLWDAFTNMFDIDRSASRGLMTLRGLHVFEHATSLGNAPAHLLFDRVTVARKEGVKAPRSFSDYTVTVEDASLPKEVSYHEMIGELARRAN